MPDPAPPPFVARLSRPVTIDHTYSRIIGPKGEFARIRIAFEPTVGDDNIDFADRSAVELPGEYTSGIEDAVRVALSEGAFKGCPLVGVTATLEGGAYHDVDSGRAEFDAAARGAVEKLALSAAIIWPPNDPRFPQAAAARA